MTSRLLSFRVTNFRSIIDSGDVSASQCTCLLGTNESGKTNLLLALWKLNPANDGVIIPLSDYPRKAFIDYESTNGEEVFVRALFELDLQLRDAIAEELKWDSELLDIVEVAKKYNNEYEIIFPNAVQKGYSTVKVKKVFKEFVALYNSSEHFTKNTDINSEFLSSMSQIESSIPAGEESLFDNIENLIGQIDSLLVVKYPKKQNLRTFIEDNLKSKLDGIKRLLDKNGIEITQTAEEQILNGIPKFIYYSDYGNLDSEIYLPHVIENFKREDLGERERAKSRSLKVLFEFVKLKPDDILELGKEISQTKIITKNSSGSENTTYKEPTLEEIEQERENKKKREVLLQSASTKLTQDFRTWWKQGEYRFRFQADGNHFRIWVSDDLRPEEIELEGRSKGLQWFFSFFLVFLVESKDTHSNCILLLDEPGLSLHPVAQQDLIEFFQSLSNQNQLLYTTHSPFLVNPSFLGDIKALYVDDAGRSVVSSDLRANKKIAEKSIYPVHAAIGLTVSDTLLLGSQPILVEGPSDQIYLYQIKNYLLSKGKFKNTKELVFISTGGVSGMSPVIRIISGRENDLPFTIIDSDHAGKEMEKNLRKNLYKDEQNKIIMVESYTNMPDSEVEDFLPGVDLSRIFAKKYRGKNTDDFDDIYISGQPIVEQMEKFAKDNGYKLELGWKVEMAKDFAKGFDRIIASLPAGFEDKWEQLFASITN